MQIFIEAGILKEALQFFPVSSADIGNALIAETGGQNAMIVDSTALPEQLVKDVISSAFGSAGQRCSALHVLFLQEEIAEPVLDMLKGAMEELVIGDPRNLATDVGPLIDQQALNSLKKHCDEMRKTAEQVFQCKLENRSGYFLGPAIFELNSMSQLTDEHFGPVLHVVRYKAEELDKVLEQINGSGFGLTLGVHSRNQTFAQRIADNVRVGNVYINRNQVGAVVGSQPFGGQNHSGTGPKAGGPNYLMCFVTEKTVSNNLVAVGGNATLLSLGNL